MEQLKANDKIFRDIKAGMNIIPREEYTSILVTISKLAADTVKKTLGPYAHTTIIDDGTFTYPTKDGWSVLSRLRFSDPIYNTLFKLLQDISFRVVNKVGDGTTTAIVAADYFVDAMNEYLKAIEANGQILRQSDFVTAINRARDMLIEQLTEHETMHIDPLGKMLEIHDIASISSNGNAEIADAIYNIYEQTHNPNIMVKIGTGTKLSYHIETGYRLDAKFLNSRLYKNTTDGFYKNNDNEPLDLIMFDHNVTYSEHKDIIYGLINYANQTQRLLLIMAPYFDDIIASVMQSALEKCYKDGQMPSIFLVQAPMGTVAQQTAAADFAILTGATMVNGARVRAFNIMMHNQEAEKRGQETITDDILQVQEFAEKTPGELLTSAMGVVRRVAIADTHITISDYDTSTLLYKNTLADVEKEFNEAKEKMRVSTTNLQKNYMDIYQRYNRLKGAMGVIEVGGQSDLEKQCTKDSVDDAVLACRSAFDSGYVYGLNISTLRAIDACLRKNADLLDAEGEVPMNRLTDDALNIMGQAFYYTTLDVFRNKYADENAPVWTYDHISAIDIMNRLLLADNYIGREDDDKLTGFNIVSERFTTGKDISVINSVGTDIEIINAMCSIITLILSSDQFLSINRTYDKKEAMWNAAEARAEQEAIIAKAKAEAFMSVIGEHPIPIEHIDQPDSSIRPNY